jgi:hypothetical protein
LSAGLNKRKRKGWKKATGKELGKNKTSREAGAYPEEVGICLRL